MPSCSRWRASLHMYRLHLFLQISESREQQQIVFSRKKFSTVPGDWFVRDRCFIQLPADHSDAVLSSFQSVSKKEFRCASVKRSICCQVTNSVGIPKRRLKPSEEKAKMSIIFILYFWIQKLQCESHQSQLYFYIIYFYSCKLLYAPHMLHCTMTAWTAKELKQEVEWCHSSLFKP